MNSDLHRTLHPTPQFRRERWTDLCGTWRFAFDDGDRGVDERWYERTSFDATIEVPYPPESKLSGVRDTSYHPVVWYAREIETPDHGPGERVVLHFGAVDYRAVVWVNGFLVGEHEGGQTPFSLDVTDMLRADRGRNTITVRAQDHPTDRGQPRGKQAFTEEPRGILYDRTTGIWQPVWLELVPAVHIAELTWNSDPGSGMVRLEVLLNTALTSPRRLDVRLGLDGVALAEQSVRIAGDGARLSFDLERPGNRSDLAWSPETPRLIDAELVLQSDDRTRPDDVPADRVHSYFGHRSVGWRDGLFLLNGQPYYLRMVLEQGFWPESHLAAPSPDALRREVELVKELGFNGIRIHQKVEDPRFLYWCDRLGLVVWGEYANAYQYSETTAERTVREWMRAVRRDRSHPCIVAWVPLNESWGVPDIARSGQQRDYASALYHLTRALDPSRLVVSNDGWEHTVSDIWGIHDYAPRGDGIRERYGTPEELSRMLFGCGPGRRKVLLQDQEWQGQPVMITEFGGLSYTPAVGEKWAGYSTVESPAELRERFEGLLDAILDCRDIAGFCYTQLTDTQQERNGLLTEDREPKLPMDQIRRIVTRPARAIAVEVVDAHRRAALRRT